MSYAFAAIVARLRAAVPAADDPDTLDRSSRFAKQLADYGFALGHDGEIQDGGKPCGDYRWRALADGPTDRVLKGAVLEDACPWMGPSEGVFEWNCHTGYGRLGRAVAESTLGPIVRVHDEALAPSRCGEVEFPLASINRRFALGDTLLGTDPLYIAYVDDRLARALADAGFEAVFIGVDTTKHETVIAHDVRRRHALTWWQYGEPLLRRVRAGVDLCARLQGSWERRALRGVTARFCGRVRIAEPPRFWDP